MKLGQLLLAASVVTTTLVGCNRNKQDAVLLANEAEKARKGDKDTAIAKLEEAVRLDPDNHGIWFKLATIHEEKEDWPKMAEALQGAITADEKVKEDGTWANYYANRGLALEMQARKKTIKYDEVKAPYEKCIEIDENYADCYHQLGNVYLWLDDEQQSLAFYTKAIEHDPSQLRYYGPLAELYINLGYMKEAEEVLKEAKSRAQPGDKGLWLIHTMMSDVLIAKNDLNGAVTELEAAKAINTGDGPEQVYTLFNLGSLYAQLNPPRKQDATDMLKGFVARICKGQKAAKFVAECESARTILTKKLNATVQ